MKILIKKTTAKLLLLTLCFTLSNCKKDETATLSPEAQLQLQLTKGLEETLKPLNGSDPSLSNTDLSILDNLGQAKIVGMGEATHGTHEFFQMKQRIFQYLVEKQGFRYIAFEYDFAACLSLDYIIQTGQGTIAEYMKENMKFWAWKTEELQSLFEWMQNYNRGKPDNQKIHVIGVDCQYTSFSIVQLIALLQIYDANYANVIKSRIGVY
jgi:erythromycin esterase